MWGPRSIAKLVSNSNNYGLWYANNELVTGANLNQRSHHVWGPHIVPLGCHRGSWWHPKQGPENSIWTTMEMLGASERLGYPLVNIQKTMENHHFSWEDSRTNGDFP